MIESTFYHSTTRRYTVAFGSIFNGIAINREAKDGTFIKRIPVPLIYSNKEKFIRRANEISSIDDETRIKETLPAMGFELLSMAYSPTRKTNTVERIIDDKTSKAKFMFNRVPYDFTFALYIATRRMDDALRIVEQIMPYFTPELNIRMRDIEGFPDIITDIPVVLLDVAMDGEADSTIDERRVINWQITFTLKGYLYTNVRDLELIKKTIVDLTDADINTFYEGYMSEVDPLNAGRDENPKIKETVTDAPRDASVLHGSSGAELQVNMD